MKEKLRKYKYLFVCLTVWLIAACFAMPTLTASAKASGRGKLFGLDNLTYSWIESVEISSGSKRSAVGFDLEKNTLTITAGVYYESKSSDCGKDTQKSTTNTVTITNSFDRAVNLTYKCKDEVLDALSGISKGQTYTVTIAAGGNVTFSVTSEKPSDGNSPAKTVELELSYSFARLPISNTKVTPKVMGNGSFLINGTTISETTPETPIDVEFDPVNLSVPAESRSKFACWMLKKSNEMYPTVCSYSPDYDWYYVEDGAEIIAVFTEQSPACFSVEENNYLFLDYAIAVANSSSNKTIRVERNGTLYLSTSVESALSDGETDDGAVSKEVSVAIPSGITLLVPYGYADTGSTAAVDNVSASSRSIFRYLIIPSDFSVTVNGTVIVNAVQGKNGQQIVGSPEGGIGRLQLDGKMSVESGGKLYARGLIDGNGSITAKYGANVYQLLQILDWRGGTSANSINGSVFPVSQFCFNNIQSKITYQYGSNLQASYYIYASNTTLSNNVSLIGTSSASPLFSMESGSEIVMQWDPEKIFHDIEVYGNVSMNKLSIQLFALGIKMDTSNYECPLPDTFSVHIMENATLSIAYRVKILPGCVIEIKEGGTLQLDANMYLYDCATYNMQNGKSKNGGFSYGGYGTIPKMVSAAKLNSSGTISKSTAGRDIEDAKLIIKGSLLTSSSAQLYCSNNSENGTNPGSTNGNSLVFAASENAVIKLNNSTNKETIYESNGYEGSPKTQQIAFKFARGAMATADGSGVETGSMINSELTSVTYYAAEMSDGSYGWYAKKAEATVKVNDSDTGIQVVRYYGANDTPKANDLKYSALTYDDSRQQDIQTGSNTNRQVTKYVLYANGLNLQHYTNLEERVLESGIHVGYALDDYLYLNADFWIDLPAGASISLMETDDGRVLELVPVADGDGKVYNYYLVYHLYAYELPESFTLTLVYRQGNLELAVPYTFDFSEHQAQTNPTLKEALDIFGVAAQAYFEKGDSTLTEEQQTALEAVAPAVVAQGTNLIAAGNASDKITNVGANFAFEDYIGIKLRFKVPAGYDEVGFLYNGKVVNDSVTVSGDYVVVMYTMPYSDYSNTGLTLQPYVKIGGTTYYGLEYTYGLKTYVARKYDSCKDDPDKVDWRNFLLSIWKLAS